MQEQAELGKTEPEEENGQADGGTVDPDWKRVVQIPNLFAPPRHFDLILLHSREKDFQTVARFGQVTTQQIGCIADEQGSLIRESLDV